MLYTFVVARESHTVGNLVADRLLALGHDFASYRVPHPLSSDVHVTIDAPNEASARAALAEACDSLLRDVRALIGDVGGGVLECPTPAYGVVVREGVPLRDEDMR